MLSLPAAGLETVFDSESITVRGFVASSRIVGLCAGGCFVKKLNGLRVLGVVQACSSLTL